MLKIYGADLSTPANKVRFVANCLGLPYEYIQVKLREGEHKSDWFLKLNPLGKIPVIDDGGFVLFESTAICKYLATKHKPGIYPAELTQRAMVDAWIDFSSLHIGAAMNRVVFNRIFAPLVKVDVDERSLQDGLNFLARFLPNVNDQLTKGKYLVGEKFSLADINLLAILDPCEVAGIDLSTYPRIVEWRRALQQQDFYTKCHKEYGEFLKQASAKR